MSSSVSGSRVSSSDARQQRRDHAEERVLRRRGDQRHPAVLHPRQQGVLLGLGEAVHLVDEQHRLAAERDSSRRAASIAARTSLTPAATAETSTNRRSVCGSRDRGDGRLAGARRPHSSSDIGWSPSTSWRSGDPGASSCCCPTSSSRCAAASARRAAPSRGCCPPSDPPPSPGATARVRRTRRGRPSRRPYPSTGQVRCQETPLRAISASRASRRRRCSAGSGTGTAATRRRV